MKKRSNSKKGHVYKTAEKLGTVAFTRTGPEFHSEIRSVPGVAVPQMPMNRAREPIENRIMEIAADRVEHNFQYMFG